MFPAVRLDGEVSPGRVNSRNGYRAREWDTRAGTVELAIPKLRHGSYFPLFLGHRRRAEKALAQVVATSWLRQFAFWLGYLRAGFGAAPVSRWRLVRRHGTITAGV